MQTIILLLTVVSSRLAHSVYSIFVVWGGGGRYFEAISKIYWSTLRQDLAICFYKPHGDRSVKVENHFSRTKKTSLSPSSLLPDITWEITAFCTCTNSAVFNGEESCWAMLKSGCEGGEYGMPVLGCCGSKWDSLRRVSPPPCSHQCSGSLTS